MALPGTNKLKVLDKTNRQSRGGKKTKLKESNKTQEDSGYCPFSISHAPPKTRTESTEDTPTFTKKPFTIGYLNALAVREKTEDIVELIIDLDLDILFITETWLLPEGHEAVTKH